MSLYFEREKLKCWPKRNYRLNSLFTARDLLCSSIIPCVATFAVGQMGKQTLGVFRILVFFCSETLCCNIAYLLLLLLLLLLLVVVVVFEFSPAPLCASIWRISDVSFRSLPRIPPFRGQGQDVLPKFVCC